MGEEANRFAEASDETKKASYRCNTAPRNTEKCTQYAVNVFVG